MGLKSFCLLVLCFTTSAFGEKLSIHLNSSSALIPATILPIEKRDEGMQRGLYEKRLERVLAFDTYFLGKFMLVDPTTHVKVRVSAAGDIYPLASSEKVSPKVQLRPYIQRGTLTIECLGMGASRAFSAPLTGVLANDRMRIHQMCDKLHEMLFNMKGVASHKIAYTLKVKDPSHARGYRAEIWESDWDGHRAHRVSSPKDFSLTPVYMPAGSKPVSKLLYVNYKTGQAKIHMLDLVKKVSHPFLTLRGNQMLPAVSPTGSHLAFICDAVGSSDLFILDLKKGKKPCRFSFAPGITHASPAFNPSSDKIVFVSDKTGQPQIYLADLNLDKGVQAIRLTEKNRQNTCPAWSPDGTKLVYVGLTDGVRQLWIYDFEKNVEKQLTFDPINKECPAWALSSAHIAYNTAEGAELHMLSLDQGESVRISREGGEKKFPTWQP